MHQSILDRKGGLVAACRKFGVRRLSVFGSAARGVDFDVQRSDADLLVAFAPGEGFDPYSGLKAEFERILGRPVDLLDEGALDESRNYIRRAAIRQDAEIVFEA